MSTKDSLGDRMKENYENRYRIFLTRRTPVIIRLDGKAFHTFTRGMDKPFDDIMLISMVSTAKNLCNTVMGCQIAYVQSDEISLLLHDYKKLESQAWFDYNLQKICSVSASIATSSFNQVFRYLVSTNSKTEEKRELLSKKFDKANFDARAFNIPESEVCNYFIWRQQDAIRNSVEAVGQANFSQKELHGKSCKVIKEMLLENKNLNWDSILTRYQRGICVRKVETEDIINGNKVLRSKWEADFEIPIFSENRNYTEELLRTVEG